jgi:hypothetical protein
METSTEEVVFSSRRWLRMLRPSSSRVVRDGGRQRPYPRRSPDGMSPRPELFAGLLGTALLVVTVGVAFALGRDMPAGTMMAGEAAAAAGVALWAMLS